MTDSPRDGAPAPIPAAEQEYLRKATWLRTLAKEIEKGLASAVPEQLQTIADWVAAALPHAPSPPTGWQPEKEIVICAAVKTVEGKIVRGHRHDGAMRYAQETMGLTLVPYGEDQQGFVTSRGRYVNRLEAAELQKAAGIKSVDNHRIDFPTELFSEDLY